MALSRGLESKIITIGPTWLEYGKEKKSNGFKSGETKMLPGGWKSKECSIGPIQ